MVYYWNYNVYKCAFVCFVSFMAIFGMIFKVNSRPVVKIQSHQTETGKAKLQKCTY